MNIMILGAHGMAGHMISKYLKLHGHIVTDITRAQVDFENKTEIDSLNFEEINFVINCVGLLVQESISRPDRATLLNSWLPHYLEYKLADTNTKLVHLSTDCVFNGLTGNYTEDDIPNETNAYGKSKCLGEINNSKDVTFRMSIIGPELKQSGTGLMHWFVNKSEDTVQGWDNAFWNGITTLELAKCINSYISNPIISGIYHVVNNNNKISKYELLQKINHVFNLEKNITRTQGPKPANKILVDTRNDFKFNIPNYDTMLNELKQFINT